MNKKKFSRIISMYHDGVSMRICTEMIMALSTSDMMASIWIEKLLNHIIDPLVKENKELLMKENGELDEFTRPETSESENNNL